MDLLKQPFDHFRSTFHPGNAEICPMCDQAIPNDRLEQVRARAAQHQRELESKHALELQAACEQIKEQSRQQNEEAMAKVRQVAEARRLAIRAEERQAAAAEVEAKVLTATAAAEAARAQAGEWKTQLEATVAATNEKVSAAQDAARKDAEAVLQPQLIAAQSAARQAEEKARILAQSAEAAHAQIAQLGQDVTAAREEGKKAADAELRTQITLAAEEKQAALNAKTAVEQQLQVTRESHEKMLREGIQETREAMEKSHRDAINAEQARHFEDKQKFQNTVDDLKRQLENKTALELGEGAEVDLYEALKEAFPADEITRIKRGVAGADIRHQVRHNGKDCGLILYDSKNHKAWRNDFVTKLRDDQISDKADHAILSTIAFPQGSRQLVLQDGVILVNPARAVAIAELVRRQVLQAHCLNLSNDDREQKSLELYSFITSERFATLLTKLHVTTDSLNELDVREQATHKLVWQKRGQLISSVAKAEADIRSEIDRIVGTADDVSEEGMAVVLSDAAGTSAQ